MEGLQKNVTGLLSCTPPVHQDSLPLDVSARSQEKESRTRTETSRDIQHYTQGGGQPWIRGGPFLAA
jgi:hypothetical protein